MKIGDIIALAKAGYKVNEIRELINLETEPQTSGVEEPAAAAPKEAAQPDPANTIEEPATAESGEVNEINELKTQLSQVRKDLEKAQKQNLTHDNSSMTDRIDPQTRLNDIVRNFM